MGIALFEAVISDAKPIYSYITIYRPIASSHRRQKHKSTVN